MQEKIAKLFAATTLATCVGVAAAQPPNVIIVLADDMGWGDVGYHGFDDIKTPSIDKLAEGGTWFPQAYVTASVCGPSRAGILSGMHQQKFGYYGNHETLSVIPHDQQNLPEMMRELGYKTGMIGKWHLGYSDDHLPWNRGFDFYYGSPTGSHDYFRSSAKDDEKRKRFYPVYRNGEVDTPIQERGDYLTTIYADEAVDFIERNKKEPFFLYLSHNAVHFPWQVHDRYLERVKDLEVHHEERRFFAGMALALDDSIGRIVDTLEKHKLDENTLLVFLSDNGTPIGQGFEQPRRKERGTTTMSSPGDFNGFKGDTYEGGIRVPMVAYWPGTIPANQAYPHPVVSYDWAATFVARSGMKQPSQGLEFDGVDLLPYITGKKPADERPHETLHWRRDEDYAIRIGDWKLTRNSKSGPQTIRLFDLENDPGERHDLANVHPEKAQMMQDTFDEWDSQLPDNVTGKRFKNRNYDYQKGKRTNVAELNEKLQD
ncbi:sulfatase [Endozoicomonas lisbonensis]|uniref:Arylsulfatase A-like enzyme n=1 Tax=Endozoicomonas lisbonensis TaxID=3120522 RepID=A0ABV2SJ85_9GAMM